MKTFSIIAAAVIGMLFAVGAAAQPYGATGTLGPAGAQARTCAGVPSCSVVNPSGAWQAAIEGAVSGATILMDAGSYTPSSTLDIPSGVTVANHAGAAVTINAALTSWVSNNVIEGVTVNALASQFAVVIQSSTSAAKSNIELKNVSIRGGTGDAVRIKGNTADITIRNSLIDGGRNNHGLLVECNADLPPCTFTPERTLITNNRFSKTVFAGVATEDLLQIEGQGDTTITHNSFGQNQTGEQCVDFKRSGRAGAAVVLAFNDMDGRAGTGCRQGPLLITQPEAGTLRVEGNHFLGGSSLFRATPVGTIVSNNLFEGGGGAEVTVASQLSRMTLGYNTFFGSGNGLTFGDSTGVPNALVVTNNIFSGTIFRGTSAWGNERSFNLLFGTSGSTLGSCPTCITGQDPLLTNGYELQSSSPAIDAAGPFTVAADIEGTARPQGAGSDIGAFEFVGAPPAPTATLTANPTTIAAGGSSTLMWSSTNATSCTGSGFITGGAPSGQQGVSPAATTTYSVHCNGASASATVTVTAVPPPSSADIKVSVSSDDAEYTTGGSLRSGDVSDLEMVLQGSTRQQVCVRFRALPIPQGATIALANIQFTADTSSTSNVSSGSGSLLFRAIDENDTGSCSSSAVSRPRTSASVTWSSVPTWASGSKTAAQRTPNLAAVVQEVVDRGGWTSGNDLAFWITSSSSIRRNAESFEGSSAKAAVLHVEWTN